MIVEFFWFLKVEQLKLKKMERKRGFFGAGKSKEQKFKVGKVDGRCSLSLSAQFKLNLQSESSLILHGNKHPLFDMFQLKRGLDKGKLPFQVCRFLLGSPRFQKEKCCSLIP